jgi:hypothetical protein
MTCEIVNPRKNESDRKTQHDSDDDQALGPVWNFERRKNLRRDLDQQPAHDRVRDRDAVNFSAF